MGLGRRAMVGGCLICALAPFARPFTPPAAAASRPMIGLLSPPVTPTCVSSPFGPRVLPGTRASMFHTGIDLPAPEGGHVHAAAGGRVAQIRRLGSAGLVVDLRHETPEGGRFVTRYAHLGTVAPALADGRRTVAPGEFLGRIGRSGITYGTHLHFEVRVDGQPVDPAPFVAVARCAGHGIA